MKFSNLKVVWTAVASAVFGVATLLSAWRESLTWAVAFGFVSLTSATLSNREK